MNLHTKMDLTPQLAITPAKQPTQTTIYVVLVCLTHVNCFA